jgi:hypothetical protein
MDEKSQLMMLRNVENVVEHPLAALGLQPQFPPPEWIRTTAPFPEQSPRLSALSILDRIYLAKCTHFIPPRGLCR